MSARKKWGRLAGNVRAEVKSGLERNRQMASFKVSDAGVVTKRRAQPDKAAPSTAVDAVAPAASQPGDLMIGIAGKVIEKSADKYWELLGGPWLAQYPRFATTEAIGIGEGEPHSVGFMDPADALEHFRGLDKRYQTNETLRRACKIVYTDVDWYMVQPFAEDADHQVDVMRAEVARDKGRERGTRVAGGNGAGTAGAINKGGSA
jgi:hypothetical protein